MGGVRIRVSYIPNQDHAAHHAQADGGGGRERRAVELHGGLEADEAPLDGTTGAGLLGLRSGASLKAATKPNPTATDSEGDARADAGVGARLGAAWPFLRLHCLGGQSEVVLHAVRQLRL